MRDRADLEHWALFALTGALLERLGGSVTLTEKEIMDVHDTRARLSMERSTSLQDDTVTFKMHRRPK